MREGFQQTTVAFDWFECAGCIEWTSESNEWFDELERVQLTAKDRRSPAPFEVGERLVNVYSTGMGQGRQTRYEFRIDWRGVTIGLSPREFKGRQVSNLYYKITGDGCLMIGAENARDVVHEIVGRLGGALIDEWFRRLDICLDLPGVDVRDELVPAMENRQFFRSAKRFKLHIGDQGKTGFTVGKKDRLHLNVYDKRLEAIEKEGEYLSAVADRRWGGEYPAAATRVEYTIRKVFLDIYGIRSTDAALRQLPEVMARVVDGPYVLFRMTDRRMHENARAMGEAKTHFLWQEIVDRFKKFAGEPVGELKPVRAGQMSLSRGFKTVLGYITSAAVQLKIPIDNIDDAVAALRELHERMEATDDDWRQSFDRKARKSGLLEEMSSFPFG